MRPIRNPDVNLQYIGDETILYIPEQKAVHVLNATARSIWDLCDGLHSLEEIETNLRDRFSVSADSDLKTDIQRTLDVLAAKKLITYLEADGQASTAPL